MTAQASSVRFMNNPTIPMPNIRLFPRKKLRYTDTEVVEGVQQQDHAVEEWFYYTARSYFNDKFNELFFDKDMKSEIFQASFLKIWTEIDNGTIHVSAGKVCRKNRQGQSCAMTCSLTTFLMAFAKNEYRELLRSVNGVSFDEVQATLAEAETVAACEDNVDALKRRIVDDCIGRISHSCREILTLFYYQQRSLDEILEIRKEQHTSKNGLKTAKNKCMNTLRGHIEAEFARYDICI